MSKRLRRSRRILRSNCSLKKSSRSFRAEAKRRNLPPRIHFPWRRHPFAFRASTEMALAQWFKQDRLQSVAFLCPEEAEIRQAEARPTGCAMQAPSFRTGHMNRALPLLLLIAVACPGSRAQTPAPQTTPRPASHIRINRTLETRFIVDRRNVH